MSQYLKLFLSIFFLLIFGCKNRATNETKKLNNANYIHFDEELRLTEYAFDDFIYDFSRILGNQYSNPKPINLELFNPIWPLEDNTPTITANPLTPMATTKFFEKPAIFFHKGIDITRSPSVSNLKIISPVKGYLLFKHKEDCSGKDYYHCHAYIYHPDSRIFLDITHIKPDTKFSNFDKPTWVEQGERLGSLVSYPPLPAEESYKHIHLVTYNWNLKTYIDARKSFKVYKDDTPPTITEMYLLDSTATRSNNLYKESFDIVASIYDTNILGGVHLEIADLAYTVFDQNNVILKQLNRCTFKEFIGFKKYKENSQALLNLFDIKNEYFMSVIDKLPGKNNIFNWQTRLFPYSLTNIERDQVGNCLVVEDSQGKIAISNSTKFIKVYLKVWDYFENMATFEHQFNIEKQLGAKR